MRIPHTIIGAALIAAFGIGCSKSPRQQPHLATAPFNSKDLGVLRFTEGTPQHFSLGEGEGCTLTAKRVSDKMDIGATFDFTNADGTVSQIGWQKVTLPPGQYFPMSCGVVTIRFTPQWNTP